MAGHSFYFIASAAVRTGRGESGGPETLRRPLQGAKWPTTEVVELGLQATVMEKWTGIYFV